MEDQLIKIILANTISATDISKIINEHSDSNILTGDHIICGLVYRLMNPMTDKEIEDSLKESASLFNDEYSSSDNEDDIINENDITDINEDNINKLTKIKSNNCNCDICIQTRVCLVNFNNYIPKDELGDQFKNSIIETCKEYNRYI